MSNRMFISTKNACVIKRFKDQVNISEPLYRMTRYYSICSSPVFVFQLLKVLWSCCFNYFLNKDKQFCPLGKGKFAVINISMFWRTAYTIVSSHPIERFRNIYLVFETFDDTCVFCWYKHPIWHWIIILTRTNIGYGFSHKIYRRCPPR
jgi:hypothetical protein